MSGDGWEGMSHAEIVQRLGALKPDGAFSAAQKWSDVYTKVSDAAEHYRSADTKMGEIWTGDGPEAARKSLRDQYTELQSEEGAPRRASKLSEALFQDGACLTNAGYVPQAYPVPPDNTDKDAKQKLLEAVRAEAQRLYTEPLDVNRPQVDDAPQNPNTGPLPQGPGGGGGGGGGNSGGGSGNNLQSPGGSTDGLADKNTKPQLANGEGQGGQGQGAGSGSGSGSGSGGGQGAGSGSGAGGSSPFGSGTGSGTGGSGLPLGATTAAGYGSSGSAGGTGLASGTAGGPSALRPGAGMPGGATSGAGSNPAAVGASGVRGGAMGPMGMMGGAGAHGKGGGHGEDDDHETPAILINLDNTYEFMGDLPKASPAVIGDWSEQEKADKQAQEREKRRYKKLGWDVEFE
ncbi:hypothetical protein [Mycobacteroides salmoniphilum]|uniref:PPE family protein n=1 Tax=Mycobacteroides salmoniphilum TaxID=404941 RepID=A0A4R8SIM0_9MYCO|nr:hypothetical protein [Mycobacteroides salmoniphilum]TDZ96876.1 hypothetical protein CCUG60885_03020 [Mycobacteroides salmoniphilum]TEA05971.1 hypothetical protein CCUG60883_03277 [Mycobacteroides salmoniphilum]